MRLTPPPPSRAMNCFWKAEPTSIASPVR